MVAIWIVSSFEQLQRQVFQILLYTVLYEQMPSFLSCKYLRVDWLDHMIIHIFNFSRNYRPIFQRGLTTLYSCQLQIGTYQEHCQWLNNKAFAICLYWDWTPSCYSCWPSTTPDGTGWSEAFCAPGNLVGQVFRQLDVFRNRFYDPNPCISSYLEKH